MDNFFNSPFTTPISSVKETHPNVFKARDSNTFIVLLLHGVLTVQWWTICHRRITDRVTIYVRCIKASWICTQQTMLWVCSFSTVKGKWHVVFLSRFNNFIECLQDSKTKFAYAVILSSVYLNCSSKYTKTLSCCQSSTALLIDFTLFLALSLTLSFSSSKPKFLRSEWQLSRGIWARSTWPIVLCLCDKEAELCTKARSTLFLLWSLKMNSWVERWEHEPGTFLTAPI